MKNVMYLELSDEQLEVVTGGTESPFDVDQTNRNWTWQYATAYANGGNANGGNSQAGNGGVALAFNINNNPQQNINNDF